MKILFIFVMYHYPFAIICIFWQFFSHENDKNIFSERLTNK